MTFKKKALSVVLTSSLAFTPLAGQFFVSSYAGATTLTAAEQEKLQAIINNLSVDDKAKLDAFELAINGASDSELDYLFGASFFDDLVANGVFATKADAYTLGKGIANVIGNSLGFSSDIEQFRADFADEFDAAFGTEVTVDTLKSFASAVEAKSKDILLSSITNLSGVSATSVLNQAISDVLNTDSRFAVLKGKLSAIGLSVQKLIDVKNNLYTSSVFGTKAIDARNVSVKAYASQYIKIVKSGSATQSSISITNGSTVDLDVLVNLIASGTDLQIPLTGTLPAGLSWAVTGTGISISNTGVVTGNAISTGNKVQLKLNDIVLGEVTVDVTAYSGGGSSGGGGGGGSTPSAPTSPTPSVPVGTKIISTPAVTVTIEKDVNGVEVTVVKVNKDDVLKELAKDKEAKAFSIPVDAKAGQAKAKIDLSVMKEAAAVNKENVFVVQANNAAYSLPANLVSQASLSSLGADLGNAEVEVNISEQPASAVKAKGKLAAKVVDFSVFVKSGDNSVELNNFGSTYVDRSLDLNVGIDNKKAVGVVVNADGSVSPVPTEFVSVEGKTVAVLKRNANSAYTVVENAVSFNDIDSHWAESNIQLMGSKLIASGYENGSFKPNGQVTRAEFVTLLARSLGFGNDAKGLENFKDVSEKDWYAGYLKAALDSKLISGYEDQTFRGNKNITRQEAAVMLVNALNFLQQRGDISEVEASQALAGYSDKEKVSGYAKEAVGVASELNIIKGMNDGSFKPANNTTRAESVTMLKNLLKQVKFLSE